MRRAVSARTREKTPSLSPLACDIAGIALAAIGAISLVSLASPKDAGEIGRDIAHLLRLLAGSGAYTFPVLAFFVSAMLLFGSLRVRFSRRSLSALSIWLVALGWLHTLTVPTPPNPSSHFETVTLQAGGGYIGAILSYLLLVAFGRISSLVLLGAAGIVAALVFLDYPVFTGISGFVRNLRKSSEKAKVTTATGKTNASVSINDRRSPAEQASASGKPTTAPVVDQEEVIAKAIESRRKALESDLHTVSNTSEVLVKTTPSKDNGQQTLALGEAEDHEKPFEMPSPELLDDSPPVPERSADELRENVEIIESTLQEFKISATVVEIAHGPTVTRYEIQLAPGIRVNKIVNLADNIAMRLSAINVRVEAPIPGKAAIGVEVPNRYRGLVGLKEVVQSPEFVNHPSTLAFPLGLDVSGNQMVADLAAMPHLLVAGATNMGKSVMLNTLITSLLYRARPDQLRLILIDPKRVELSLFEGIPHLCHPVVRDIRQAAGILRAAVQEMERRYDKLANKGTRNIQNYNEQVSPGEQMPYIVIVVDELADLMMQAAAEVEGSICRIAQLARAVGIHLVIATQRPSVDVVTGTIKANIASRIAFAVSSQVDSRTVLDQNGAERLIGKGDMLFRPIDAPKPIRIQGAFISEQETKRVVEFLRAQRAPDYNLTPVEAGAIGGGGEGGDDMALADEYYLPAVDLVVRQGRASTSMIQRRFRIGYTRAARLVDAMEMQGIVGPADGANPREVLISADRIDEILGLPSGTTKSEREMDEEEFEE